jgi:hypothetical protein
MMLRSRDVGQSKPNEAGLLTRRRDIDVDSEYGIKTDLCECIAAPGWNKNEDLVHENVTKTQVKKVI